MNRRRFLSAVGVMAGVGVLATAAAAGTAQLPRSARSSILRDPGTPAAGAARADVTVVEYFDYNCPYCRLLQPELDSLMRSDPKVRVIYKDWPIFGDVSRYAARAALAARWQGRYLAAHDALIGTPERLASEAQVREVLQRAGLDMARLDRDLKVHGGEIDRMLERDDLEAQSLGLEGTPGLIIGSELIPGGMPLAALQRHVALARTATAGPPRNG